MINKETEIVYILDNLDDHVQFPISRLLEHLRMKNAKAKQRLLTA